MLYKKYQIVVVNGFVSKILETPKFKGSFYKVIPLGHSYGDYRYVTEDKIRAFGDIYE